MGSHSTMRTWRRSRKCASLQQLCDSVAYPEARMWLSTIVFYKMRSRVYPTSGCGQVTPI